MAKKQKLRRSIAAIMAITLVAGAFPVQPISELIMPKLSVSAADTATTAGVDFKNMRIVVGGKLGVIFGLKVEDSFQYADTAYIKVSCAGKELKRMNLSDIETVNGVKEIEADIPAKQMTDTITAEVFINSTATKAVESVSKSVKDYADYMLASSSTSAEVKKVVKAMLNYGAYSQKTFSYKTTNLANADLTAAEKNAVSSVTAATVSNYQSAVIEENESIGTLQSISLDLESEVSLNVKINIKNNSSKFMKFTYFDGNEEKTIENVAVSADANGNNIATLTITDIPVKSLGKDVIITAASLSGNSKLVVKCSALTYAKSAMDTTDAKYENVRKTAAALYLYNQAAMNYFDSARNVQFKITNTDGFKEHGYNAKKAYEENGKFYFTIPATCTSTDNPTGFGNLEVDVIENNLSTSLSKSDYSVVTNKTSGVSVLVIDSAKVPSGATIDVETTVSDSYKVSIDNEENANLTISSTETFKNERFEATLKAKEGYSLPDTIKIAMVGTDGGDDILSSDTTKNVYTYDKATGKIVIFNVTGAITIKADAVKSNTVVVAYLSGIQADIPSSVGESFKTTLKVTDKTKYELPKEINIISTEEAKTPGFNTVYDDKGNISGYTPISEFEIPASTKYEVGTTYKTTEMPTAGFTYYIYDIDAKTGEATLEVKGINEEELYISAKANKFFNVTTDFNGVKVTKIGTATATDDDLPATVTENETYLGGDTITLGLTEAATKDGSLIMPTSIDVYVAGKKIDAATTNYEYTVNSDGKTATLIFKKAFTGDIKIAATASEYCTLTKNLIGLELNNNSSMISTGDIELVLSPKNSFDRPATIKVTLNGTTLTDGKEYLYDAKTGKIVVLGLEKGDKLNISATGVNTYGVTLESPDGTVTIPSYDATVKTGDTWSVKLTPNANSFDKGATLAVKTPTVTVANKEINTDKLDNTGKEQAYYEFNESTGLLTVYNINGDVKVSAEAGQKFNLTCVSAGGTDAQHVTSVTLAQNSVFKDTAYAAKVTATLSVADKQFDISDVYAVAANGTLTPLTELLESEIKPGEHETRNDAILAAVTNTSKWYYDVSTGMLYIGKNVNSDIQIKYTSSNAAYNYAPADATKLVHVSVNEPSEDVKYGGQFTAKLSAGMNYTLPDSIVVYMGGEALASSAYTYDKNSGAFTVNNVKGNITIEAYANSKVAKDISFKIRDNSNSEINDAEALALTIPTGEVVKYGDTYTLDLTSALSGSDDYKYDVEGVKVSMGTTELAADKYSLNGGVLVIENVTDYITIKEITVKERKSITVDGLGEVFQINKADNTYYIEDVPSSVAIAPNDSLAIQYKTKAYNSTFTDTGAKITVVEETDRTKTVTITGISTSITGNGNNEYQLVNAEGVIGGKTVEIGGSVVDTKVGATNVYTITIDKTKVGANGIVYGKITVNPDYAYMYDLPTEISVRGVDLSSNTDGTFTLTVKDYSSVEKFTVTAEANPKTAVENVTIKKDAATSTKITFYKQADTANNVYIAVNPSTNNGLDTTKAYSLVDGDNRAVANSNVTFENGKIKVTITGTELTGGGTHSIILTSNVVTAN